MLRWLVFGMYVVFKEFEVKKDNSLEED